MTSVTRRDFLASSAIALAAMPAAKAAAQTVAPSDKVRVGLIGCGGMGRGDLATFFLNPEVDCPIVCDID
ncbi:MAG: twin-arginine translocation signal domain-containing protein, partial [Candidatus Hydrogenedentes bacterium]|nr:twin-arginine translocation signal domain-containing protein [Candidatus Hydrogenedentota bacterium]